MPRWLLSMSADRLLTPDDVARIYAANWAVSDWYIDGTIGDDDNDGATTLTPLRTGAELAKRLGPHALWGQSVTVHVMANGMTDALVVRGTMLVAGTHLDVVGTPTQIVDAGTVATYTAANHATPEATLITATGIADWTAYERKRLRVTSGARAGTIAWLAKANPALAGLNVVRTTKPIAVDVTSTSVMTVSVVLSPGDPIVVESLPSVPDVQLYVDGPVSSNGSALYPQRQWAMRDISTPTFTTVAPSNSGLHAKLCFGNRLSRTFWNQAPTLQTLNLVTAYGCSMFLETGANLVLLCNLSSCLLGDGHAITSLTIPVFQFNVLAQACNLLGNFGVPLFASDVQIFDTVGASTQAFNVTHGSITNLSGSGNAGFGVGIQNGASVRLNGTQNLLGAVSNGRLSSTPAVSLTLPQLLQSSDYAQKGTTAAMTAGTITVTVPWYDNTAQKVTATHAAFAGTPGILSVQQISTTQFTITSSSAADTSTVNWQISPLGRNAFVAL